MNLKIGFEMGIRYLRQNNHEANCAVWWRHNKICYIGILVWCMINHI